MECEACGAPVDLDTPGTFTIEYTEEYGFCEEHAPGEDEIEEVKQRIKQGLDPAPTEDDVEAFRDAMEIDTSEFLQDERVKEN